MCKYEQENMHIETYFMKLIREYKQKGTCWLLGDSNGHGDGD